MRVRLDCVTCFQEQALRAARAAGVDERMQERVLRRVMSDLATAPWDSTPMAIGMPVHRAVRELTGIDDPFASPKREATEAALAHLPELRRRVREAADPLRMAARIAIAGNIIDLGALDSFDLDETLERVIAADFAIDDYSALHQAIERAESVLLFADNAGEIVFDRLLLETIVEHRQPRLSVVVKSGPFINDATIEDARQAGLGEIAGLELLEVGNGDEDGAPAYGSAEVARWIAEHDVVISKGQGNYEALSDVAGVFFLLMVKCPCVAECVGVGVGEVVLQQS